MSDRPDDMVEARPKLGLGHSKGTKRDWTDALTKRDLEGCRLAGHPLHACEGMVEAAHTIGRRYDSERVMGGDMDSRSHPWLIWVDPDGIVPLCQPAHREYDSYRLDILPYLTFSEQAYAVSKVGIVRALARLTGGQPKATDHHSADWHDGYQTGHAEAERFNADGSYRGQPHRVEEEA